MLENGLGGTQWPTWELRVFVGEEICLRSNGNRPSDRAQGGSGIAI